MGIVVGDLNEALVKAGAFRLARPRVGRTNGHYCFSRKSRSNLCAREVAAWKLVDVSGSFKNGL